MRKSYSNVTFRRLALVMLLCSSWLFGGCAANMTRFTDFTPYAKPHESCSPLCDREMVLIPFDITQTDVTVALYGGILQNRQPLWMVLSEEERREIHQGAPQAVLYGFIEELRDRGFKVRLAAPGETAGTEPSQGVARIEVKLKKLRLNIYDRGLSGYGSAGDYTEAELDFLPFNVRLNGVDYPVTLAKNNYYAKTEGSLLAFIWSFGEFTAHLFEWTAKLATGMSKSPVFEIPKMRIEKGKMSPAELAARLAAIDFIAELRTRLPPRN